MWFLINVNNLIFLIYCRSFSFSFSFRQNVSPSSVFVRIVTRTNTALVSLSDSCFLLFSHHFRTLNFQIYSYRSLPIRIIRQLSIHVTTSILVCSVNPHIRLYIIESLTHNHMMVLYRQISIWLMNRNSELWFSELNLNCAMIHELTMMYEW